PFTGQLSQSWPRSADQEPINVGDAAYSPLFPFGWGLTTPGAQGTGRSEPAALSQLRLQAEQHVQDPAAGVSAAAADALARADVATLKGDYLTAGQLYWRVLHA
ncbi:MAG: glycosyl hydrolase, partial [Mycobacterium sp.]|nr:glycosyl hydrolase [Mycobacterium sp.]